MWHFQKKHKICALISLSTGYTGGFIVTVTVEGPSASERHLLWHTMVSELMVKITLGI